MFGPVIYWEESYPIGAGFNPSNIRNYDNSGWYYISTIFNGENIIVSRCYYIAPQFNNSFPTLNQTNQWVSPTANRLYTPFRNVKYNLTESCWLTGSEWSYYSGSNNTLQQLNNRRFWELSGSLQDTIISSSVFAIEMNNWSWPGPMNMSGIGSGGDVTGILLSSWWNTQSLSPTSSVALTTQYLGCVGDALEMSSLTGSLLQMPLQVESINLLTSEVNGLNWINNSSNRYTWQNNTIPGFLQQYEPGGWQVHEGYVQNSAHYFPADCYYSWAASGSSPNYTADQTYKTCSTLGIPTYLLSSAPYSAFQPVPNGLGGYISGFTPTFWNSVSNSMYIKIDDVSTYYGSIGTPFVLNKQIMPVSFGTIIGAGSVSEFWTLPSVSQIQARHCRWWHWIYSISGRSL